MEFDWDDVSMRIDTTALGHGILRFPITFVQSDREESNLWDAFDIATLLYYIERRTGTIVDLKKHEFAYVEDSGSRFMIIKERSYRMLLRRFAESAPYRQSSLNKRNVLSLILDWQGGVNNEGFHLGKGSMRGKTTSTIPSEVATVGGTSTEQIDSVEAEPMYPLMSAEQQANLAADLQSDDGAPQSLTNITSAPRCDISAKKQKNPERRAGMLHELYHLFCAQDASTNIIAPQHLRVDPKPSVIQLPINSTAVAQHNAWNLYQQRYAREMEKLGKSYDPCGAHDIMQEPRSVSDSLRDKPLKKATANYRIAEAITKA